MINIMLIDNTSTYLDIAQTKYECHEETLKIEKKRYLNFPIHRREDQRTFCVVGEQVFF